MIRGSVSKGWLHGEGGFTFPEAYYIDPWFRREQDRDIDRFLAERFPDLPIYNMESNLVQPDYLPKKCLQIGGIQPNLMVGAMLGAEMVFPPGADSDIAGKPFENISSAAELPAPEELLSKPPARTLDRQLETFSRKYPDFSIIPPFFWDLSGRATIHGFITTAYKFMGEKLFILLFEDPELVNAVHRWICDAYRILIDHFSRKAGLEVTGIHIGECTGAIISAPDFEKHILPFAKETGRRYRGVRFHSCGLSDHLLDQFLKIDNLISLDTGSGTSVGQIRKLFGKDLLIELAPPVELMLTGADPKDAGEWLDRTLAENRGGPLLLGYHLEPGYNLSVILALHEKCIEKGLSKPGRKKLY